MRIAIRAKSIGELEGLLNGLALADLAQLRKGLAPPNLYSGRIRYRREPLGREQWLLARDVARLGHGDCEDLSAYHCAVMWLQGKEDARCVIRQVRPGLKHALVEYQGRIIDPSKRLGMRGAG